MVGIGKSIRLERIIDRNTGRTVIVPMDHGVTLGPIGGLVDMKNMVNEIAQGGANAVVGHIGLVLHGHRKHGRDLGLILHLSGSTVWAPDPNAKVLVNNVEMALKLGADAVSIHINIGAENEAEMLEDFGAMAVKCLEWGVPLLAMVYPRGEKCQNGNMDEAIIHGARLAGEIGADIVKVSYPSSKEVFKQVVAGCPIPVVIAGGEKASNLQEFFGIVKDSLDAGGAGVSIGRNVFQHEDKTLMLQAISGLVHNDPYVFKTLEALGVYNF